MSERKVAGTRAAEEGLEITELGPDNDPPFSAFSKYQKRWIIILAALIGMFSPMSSFIFYPAITPISEGLGVTVELVNLAITAYMIVSGIVPALLGNAADTLGRRPAYIFALTLYLAANLGLAIQNTYAGLLVLRMLQSAGSSGTISLGYGVISDLTTRATRGLYVGILLLGPNVAPPIGPVLGGVLASRLGWKSIFWFLCIFGGVCLILIVVALPETCRVIVGNGTIPVNGIHRSMIPSLVEPDRTITTEHHNRPPKPKLSFPSPIVSLKLLLEKEIALILFCNGIYYTIYCCIQASLSTLFIEVYQYESLEAGLVYIPFGVACLMCTLVWGKVLNYDYERIGRQLGVRIYQARLNDSAEFPIAKARLHSALYLVLVCTTATVGYGWAIHFKIHIAAPLVLQALVGFSTTGLFVALGTLLTDLNPYRSSTAAASANLVRCALAAVALSVLQLMIDSIGIGWCFTIFGALSGLCGPLMLWEIRIGGSSRQERAAV